MGKWSYSGYIVLLILDRSVLGIWEKNDLVSSAILSSIDSIGLLSGD